MGNQCQFITYPDHDRVYRACIYTCRGDGCNAAPVFVVVSMATLALSLTVTVILLVR
jgi:hypothetical protein